MSIVWPEDTKLHALVKAAYTLNIRAQTGEGKRSYSEMSESGNSITYGNMADISE